MPVSYCWMALILAAGIAPPEMRGLVAERLARLDHLVVEMTSTAFTCPGDASPLDRSNWRPYEIPFSHRMKIVRPNLLEEYLTDMPERGYVPAVFSVFDGAIVRRHGPPLKDGRTLYHTCDHDVQLFHYMIIPLLQVLDIHIQDSQIPQLNILRLFDEYEVTLVGTQDGVSTYQATVSGPYGPDYYEFDLNARGTPLRLRTTTTFPSDPTLRPAIREMFTVGTVEVNGAELPVESVVTVLNPNVATHYGVHYLEVTSVSVDESLTAQDVQIVPDTHNAAIEIVHRDGRRERHNYDAAGNLVGTVWSGLGASPVDGTYVPRDSVRWRWLVPVACGAAGLAAMVTLRFVSRRHAH